MYPLGMRQLGKVWPLCLQPALNIDAINSVDAVDGVEKWQTAAGYTDTHGRAFWSTPMAWRFEPRWQPTATWNYQIGAITEQACLIMRTLQGLGEAGLVMRRSQKTPSNWRTPKHASGMQMGLTTVRWCGNYCWVNKVIEVHSFFARRRNFAWRAWSNPAVWRYIARKGVP